MDLYTDNIVITKDLQRYPQIEEFCQALYDLEDSVTEYQKILKKFPLYKQ